MKFFWPDVDTLEDAKKACHNGAAGAFLVAIVTGAVVGLHMAKVDFIKGLPISPLQLVDAGIFLILGFFLLRCSRIAALIALVLYLGNQIYTIQTHGFRFSPLAVVLICYFMGAVRGAFSFHEVKADAARSDNPAAASMSYLDAESAQEKAKPKKNPFKLLAAILIFSLIPIVGFLFWYYSKYSKKSYIHISSASDTAALKKIKPSKQSSAAAENLPPAPGSRTFKLRDGRTVSGKVIYEDEIYYTVEVLGGKQEIVIKEDLK